MGVILKSPPKIFSTFFRTFVTSDHDFCPMKLLSRIIIINTALTSSTLNLTRIRHGLGFFCSSMQGSCRFLVTSSRWVNKSTCFDTYQTVSISAA